MEEFKFGEISFLIGCILLIYDFYIKIMRNLICGYLLM